LGTAPLRRDLVLLAAAAALCALLAGVLALPPEAGAASLEAKLASGRSEAGSITAALQESNAELAAAESEAAAAEARQQRLANLLSEGEERAAELSSKVARTRARLAAEKARLRRSRRVLADRLVAIYEGGTPSTASLVLGSSSYQGLIATSDYLSEIAEADSALADRVEQVRNAVHREVAEVAGLRARAVAYDERLAAAHDEISAVHEAAQASASRLQSVSAGREASLSTLQGKIAGWVTEIQEARAATEAEAEEEVGRWLGGPYSIPTYIVMCESGGDYGAVNPSSGAGGAYQILPSTWELYGGQGEPQNGSKAEQDRIAGEIWADSGASAWVCG
jgi:septal ring factor EnvC (AmiA/AmiB activator)